LRCDYEMKPSVRAGTSWKRPVVWRCSLEVGHSGDHMADTGSLRGRDAIRSAYAAAKESSKTPKSAVAPGIEVPLESVLKYTKSGAINTQSTLGKVADLALSAGCEVKAGKSEALTWIQGAHHGLRFSVAGTTVVMNGRVVPKEELLIRLEEMA